MGSMNNATFLYDGNEAMSESTANCKLSSKTLFTGVTKIPKEDKEEADVEAWRKPTSNPIIQFSDYTVYVCIVKHNYILGGMLFTIHKAQLHVSAFNVGHLQVVR